MRRNGGQGAGRGPSIRVPGQKRGPRESTPGKPVFRAQRANREFVALPLKGRDKKPSKGQGDCHGEGDKVAHDLADTHKERLNADLLAFLKT